ncbi:LysR family transcriptional regulator [Pseudomonas sp. NPDC089401]|uniref:LysR family transcriptional regulator n=1 Tax=Pseudomonas sp. NPDC089401 TaxID=3364462 RepID=UPI00381850DA
MIAFVKTVDLGSFTAAGEALQITAQGVGKQVHMLETHLGVRLLNRTTRRQHLTDVGTTYYYRTKAALAEIAAAEDLAAEFQGVPRGVLRINAPVTFSNHALSTRLGEYLKQNPGVSVELTQSNRYIDMIQSGVDIVFRVGELTDSGLSARALKPYRLVLCAAPGYLEAIDPITHPRDLQACQCLGFAQPELKREWRFQGREEVISVAVQGQLSADTGEALLGAARAGLGLILQPLELVQEDLAEGRLVEVLPEFPSPSRPMNLIFVKDRQMTPKVRSFIDFAVQHFG